MAKRFTETTKWTGNKWFRKLPSKYKLLWLYMLDTCNTIGLWEEDIELAQMILGEDFDKTHVIEYYEGRITVLDEREKWWIKDFCTYQYGLLDELSTSKPVISHVSLLKKEGLWIGYTKGMDTLKDKDKDKDKLKVKVKDKDIYSSDFLQFWDKYPNKTAKFKAGESWKKQKPVLSEVLSALSWQTKLEQWTNDGGQYVPMATTYINQRRWEDPATLSGGTHLSPEEFARVEETRRILREGK